MVINTQVQGINQVSDLTAVFWSANLATHTNSIIDADNKLEITYSELNQRIDALIERLPATRQLVALVAHNNLNFLISYLALLRAKHVVLLIEKNTDQANNTVQNRHQKILNQYQVNYLIEQQEITLLNEKPVALHASLALLLSTSGSTGSAKLVKLSYHNLTANTQSICQYLPIKSTDCVVTTLPLHYSFGLSILHTHLAVGAKIVLTQASPIDKSLWQIYKDHQPSSFYGVPFSFELLTKLQLKRLPLASVQYMAQAGGQLSEATCQSVNNWCQENNKALFLMYGQTEACARIAYLPPKKVATKSGYIGQVIPHGELAIINKQNQHVTLSNTVGELCYRGGNVFIGYAENVNSLATYEEIDWLHTGDLAVVDNDGDYKLVGRIKRIVKIMGKRISLDEVERHIRATTSIDFAISNTDDMLTLYYVDSDAEPDTKQSLNIEKLQQDIADFCHINRRYINLNCRALLPRKSNGKVDYMALSQ